MSTAQPQSGHSTSIKCWSGFMKPSDELHVFASSPRRIIEDAGGSCPTFPSCWLDCRQVRRLCSSLTQGWCTQVRFQSPASVRLRTSRRKKHSQFRTRQTLFCWAVYSDSVVSSTVCVVTVLLPLRMGVARSSLLCELGLRPHCHARVLPVSLRARALGMECTCLGFLVASLVTFSETSQTRFLWQSCWAIRCRIHSWTVLAGVVSWVPDSVHFLCSRVFMFHVSSWFLSGLGLRARCVAHSSWACFTWISSRPDGRKFEAVRR